MGRRVDPENRAGKSSEQAELPQGVLTFLLTDIEASTPLWERHGASMGTALGLHQALIARTVAAHDGRLIKRQGEGDSTLSVFVRASDAVAAAVTLQRALYRGPPCTPGRRSCATATTSGRRSTGPPGCGPWAAAARSCCPGRRPSWWPTSSPKGPAWPTSDRTC
jgi:hypothetical protein